MLNQENFLICAKNFDLLKFKASYGVQGNDNLGYSGLHNYNYYSDHYGIADANGDFALSMTYKGNKDITWESSHNFNTGFDFEFFKRRLRGTVEYFSRKTVDMLYERPVAPSLGYSAIPMNVGSMSNSGFELDIQGDLVRTKNVNWTANFNITSVKNVINELHPDLDGEMIDGSWVYREGESSYQMYIREWAGVDEETGAAMWYIDVPQMAEDGVTPLKDANGEPIVKKETTTSYTNATRYGTGDILPKAYGGFGTNLSAYGFDFGISFSYQLGGKIWDYTCAELQEMKLFDTDETIPTLAEALELINGQVPILVEYKMDKVDTDVCAYSHELLKDYEGPYAVQSFHPFALFWYRQNANDIPRGILA